MRLEVLKMFIEEYSVKIDITSMYTTIKSYYNNKTHVDMLLSDLRNIARDYNTNITITHTTPTNEEYFNCEDTICSIVDFSDEYDFTIIHIELYYH